MGHENTAGLMNDIKVIGLGNSELDGYLESAVAAQGRWIRAAMARRA